MPRFHIPPYIRPVDECDLPREGRTFREVLEAVQNGMEQLGEQVSKSEYDFKKSDEVDMTIEPQLFVSKLDLGAEMSGMGDFEDRLADRLGIGLPEPEPAPEPTNP